MDFQSGLFLYLIIIFSAIIHEYSHGWMAYRLGDPTAKNAGRLTLNPLAHIDLWGTVLLPLILMIFFRFFIGYAKPVPFNPYNFRDYKKGTALVGLAGPGSNLLLALILGLIIRFLGNFGVLTALSPFLAFIVLINIWLALFNLIPVPPLDGSKILYGFLPDRWQGPLNAMEAIGPFGIIIALFIAFMVLPFLARSLFNLIIGPSLIF